MRIIFLTITLCFVQLGFAWGQPHAGAIDTADHGFATGYPAQSPGPTIAQRVANNARCTCTLNKVEGPTTAPAACPVSGPNPGGCRNYDTYRVSTEYKTVATCIGGAQLDRVLWDKSTNSKSTIGDVVAGNARFAARYRWCDATGTNALEGRADFCCKQQGATSSVKAPVCTPGLYTICAYAIFECQGTSFTSSPKCTEVTAR
jgi:hypothetical protein